jgi:EAL domain-containing protein (putative c-di-GMP-specific phosphodiesterase class I)
VPRVAVNVSAIQLRRSDFVQTVRRAIELDEGAPGIDLEITESLVMEDIESNIVRLEQVRELGVGIAVDDFGTGYSSLRYLALLPVQTLKIDRVFVDSMLKEASGMTLVSTMISLAHSLSLKVVAEGVETEAQANKLRELRCDEMQGYWFNPPLPFDRMTQLLTSTQGAFQ